MNKIYLAWIVQQGYGWRILFVTCLMPWLCKYRILTREEEDDALIVEGLSDKMKRNLKINLEDGGYL